MKDDISQLANEILLNGSEDDLSVLYQVLVGLKQKKEGKYSSYVGALLNMEKESTSTSCSVTIPYQNCYNSLGIVHGGITATVLDSAMGTLANLLAPEGACCYKSIKYPLSTSCYRCKNDGNSSHPSSRKKNDGC